MLIVADSGSGSTTPLSWDQTLIGLVIVVGAVLLAGLIVLWMRRKISGGGSDPSLIRSWLAIALVVGLLLFTVFSFHLGDQSLSSTLVGATAASAGSVVAFYFASKSSDQARQDILGAIFPTVSVPDVTGQSKGTAQSNLLRAQLSLEVAAGSATTDTAKVQSQKPEPHAQVRPGSTVEVTLAEST